MGRRLLKYRICNPITGSKELQFRYKMIDLFFKKSKDLKDVDKLLNEIIDIERLHRKMGLQYLKPFEFYSLTTSYDNITKLMEISEKFFDLNDYNLSKKDILNFKNYINEYKNCFIMEEMAKCNFHNIENSFIQENIDEGIDKIQNEIKNANKYFDDEIRYLSNIIETDCDFVKNIIQIEMDIFFILQRKDVNF